MGIRNRLTQAATADPIAIILSMATKFSSHFIWPNIFQSGKRLKSVVPEFRESYGAICEIDANEVITKKGVRSCVRVAQRHAAKSVGWVG